MREKLSYICPGKNIRISIYIHMSICVYIYVHILVDSL